MISLPTLLERVDALDEAELTGWIERSWVRAEATPQGWHFHEVDVARVRLILVIRRDCAIDEDTMPLVLSLLDQVYRLRRQLAALSGAVATQPDAVRQQILGQLTGDPPG